MWELIHSKSQTTLKPIHDLAPPQPMALSFAPPPPDPPLTPTTTAEVTTTTSTTTARPFSKSTETLEPSPLLHAFNQAPLQSQPQLRTISPSTPSPHPHDPSQLLYPVASSGRGFLHRPVTMPASRPVSRPPLVFPYGDPGQGNMGFVRPTYLTHTHLGSAPGSVSTAALAGGTGGGVIPGVSSKEFPSQFLTNQRNKDDTLAVIRDRKIRISDNASLYSFCRSWLRNGFPEETQPQYVDAVKSLPRPLPAAALVFDSPEKKEGNKEEGDEINLCGTRLDGNHLLRGDKNKCRCLCG